MLFPYEFSSIMGLKFCGVSMGPTPYINQQANNCTLINLFHNTIGPPNSSKETSMKLVKNDNMIRALSKSRGISKSEEEESWSSIGNQDDVI